MSKALTDAEIEEISRRARRATRMQPWVPISDPSDIKAIAKFSEEQNEAGAAVSRALGQGMEGVNPATGERNRAWVAQELADLQATIEVMVVRFGLDVEMMEERRTRKRNQLWDWIACVRADDADTGNDKRALEFDILVDETRSYARTGQNLATDIMNALVERGIKLSQWPDQPGDPDFFHTCHLADIEKLIELPDARLACVKQDGHWYRFGVSWS